MKITFIGSSHGVPEPNRKCSCIMLEVGERIYFLDMGTSAVDALRTRGLPVENVHGIFLTHMHGDHTNGLIPFIDLLTWYFKQADPVICIPVIAAAKLIREWMDMALNLDVRDIRYQQTEEGLVYDDGALRVTAKATQHCPRSFAYLVEAEGKQVLFTGDLKHPSIDFPALAFDMPLDLIVCESAHFPATDYLPVFDKCNVSSVCVTHYSDAHLESVLQLQAALKAHGIQALRATDDLTLNV